MNIDAAEAWGVNQSGLKNATENGHDDEVNTQRPDALNKFGVIRICGDDYAQPAYTAEFGDRRNSRKMHPRVAKGNARLAMHQMDYLG